MTLAPALRPLAAGAARSTALSDRDTSGWVTLLPRTLTLHVPAKAPASAARRALRLVGLFLPFSHERTTRRSAARGGSPAGTRRLSHHVDEQRRRRQNALQLAVLLIATERMVAMRAIHRANQQAKRAA
jgi:hypothetical protein